MFSYIAVIILVLFFPMLFVAQSVLRLIKRKRAYWSQVREDERQRKKAAHQALVDAVEIVLSKCGDDVLGSQMERFRRIGNVLVDSGFREDVVVMLLENYIEEELSRSSFYRKTLERFQTDQRRREGHRRVIEAGAASHATNILPGVLEDHRGYSFPEDNDGGYLGSSFLD